MKNRGRYNFNLMLEGQNPIANGLNTLINTVNRYYELEEAEVDILIRNWYRGMNQIADRRKRKMDQDFVSEYRKIHRND